MTHILDDAGTAAIWAATVLWTAWIVQYSLLAHWWDNVIGITLVGLAVCLIAIYVPSLLALADPAGFARFASTNWYHWLAAGIVTASAVFGATRVAAWELLRRQRKRRGAPALPAEMAARISQLEDEVATLRTRLEEETGG